MLSYLLLLLIAVIFVVKIKEKNKTSNKHKLLGDKKFIFYPLYKGIKKRKSCESVILDDEKYTWQRRERFYFRL